MHIPALRSRGRSTAILALLALFTTQCSQSDTFATKEEAEAWFTRNVFIGSQCARLVEHNSKTMRISVTNEKLGDYEGAKIVLRWVTMVTRFGKERACTLEKKALCDDAGKVTRVDSVDHPCI
jgi:hypothetical protein